MSVVIDELHGLVNDLEDEGHSLAGRFRDLVENIKADFKHLLSGGENELEVFVQRLVGTLVPELDKVKADIVAQVLAELHKVVDEVKTVVETTQAPAQVEPSATAAPAQG